MDYKMIFNLIGGLGLFIFGMTLMGEGLQKTAGDRLKKLLEILTNNRLMGILVGAGVTAIIQSSSATTVMVVGFVNAGLMTLAQAAGVIMGANIGTTITAQLIAFKLTTIAPIVVGIGIIMYLFGQRKKIKNIGEILLGFGILFMGMQIMESSMSPLKDMPEFRQLIVDLSKNPLLGVLIGLAMTAIVQSSSATIGILMALTSTGLVSMELALPVLFGDNIGTCVTALLAGVGANKTAKRAAFLHLTIKITGVIIFLIFLNPFKEAIDLIARLTGTVGNVQRDIANAHTLFNVMSTVMLAPFITYLIAFVTKIIPGDDGTEAYALKYLDERIIETPSIAVGQTIKEVVRMGGIAAENLKSSIESFFNEDEKLIRVVYEKEELINYLEKEITSFLIKLSQEPLSPEQAETATSMFHTINDLERIGDHSENLVELAQYRIDNNLKFSAKATEELTYMFNLVYDSVKNAVNALETNNIDSAMSVIVGEKEIDDLEKRLRADHIERLNQGVCVPASGTVFLDIISNLERVADHANNIAQAVVGKLQ